MSSYLIVFVGAGLGGALRHFVNLTAMRLGEPTFIGTLVINVTGSFVMGLIAEYFALRSYLPQEWRLFLTTGLIGGYTTFSAYSLEAVLLYERGEIATAASYVLCSVAFSIGALFGAIMVLRILLKP